MEKNEKAVATQTTQAPAKVQQKPHEIFKSQLDHYESTIVKLISDTGMKPEKFIEMVYTAVRKQPDLLACDRASLFGAILTAAELGLKPNTIDGFCYIIPYKEKGNPVAQFQIGYQGLLTLMYRNPDVEKIESERVFAKDEFDYEIFPVKRIIKHKPFIPKEKGETRGPLVAVYCTIKLKGIDEKFFEITFKEDLDTVQKLSKAGSSSFSPYNSGADWNNWMQRKVPVKQIYKTMRRESAPVSTQRGIEIDDLIEQGGIFRIDENTKKVVPVILEESQVKLPSRGMDSIINKQSSEAFEIPEVDPVEVKFDEAPDPNNRQFAEGSFETPNTTSDNGKLNL